MLYRVITREQINELIKDFHISESGGKKWYSTYGSVSECDEMFQYAGHTFQSDMNITKGEEPSYSRWLFPSWMLENITTITLDMIETLITLPDLGDANETQT